MLTSITFLCSKQHYILLILTLLSLFALSSSSMTTYGSGRATRNSASYIVRFDDSMEVDAVEPRANELAQKYNVFPPTHVYKFSIKGFSVTNLESELVGLLRAEENVIDVEVDGIVTTSEKEDEKNLVL
jgi:hypothetical protein